MTKRLSEILGVSATAGKFLHESSTTPGVWEIRVIESGEGSSGFYPAEMLERDGAKAFPAGTQMYANHDGWEDAMGGGDIRRLVAKTVTPATYKDGALYANVKVSQPWQQFVEDFYDVIGVSISTTGDSEIGTIGEYTGQVVTSLENDPYTSIDLVRAPGAGGKFTRMLESAKRIVETGKNSIEASMDVRKENQVELKDVQEALVESNKALITALIEALKPAAPVEGEVDYAAAAEAVVAESFTPTARKRIFESVAAGKSVEDAIKVEKAQADEYKTLFESAVPAAVTVGVGRVVESGAADKFNMASAIGGVKVGA